MSVFGSFEAFGHRGGTICIDGREDKHITTLEEGSIDGKKTRKFRKIKSYSWTRTLLSMMKVETNK